MDKVLVTGLLIIASVTAAAVIFGTIGPSIGKGSDAARQSQLAEANKIATRIKVLDAIPQFPQPQGCQAGGRYCVLDLWVKNIGQADVLPISHMDIFMIGSTGDWGDYIRFEKGCSTSTTTNCWSYIPPNQDPANRDMIMVPNETLHIQMRLFSDPLSPGYYSLDVTTPNGVQDKFLFEVASP